MTVRVVTAREASARDGAAIAAGIPSRALMQRAGAAAAAVIADTYGDRLAAGVVVFAGPGNNGGDAWVVARHLVERGAAVTVCEVGDSRTPDARAERERALASVHRGAPGGAEGLVIDGVLGTGARGAPQGHVATAIAQINMLRHAGAAVAALDVPTGLDASTGEAGTAVQADLTVTFGTVKRGHLIARGVCGEVVVVDIGLGPHADLDDGAPRLVDEAWVAQRVPHITAESHKGLRRRIVIAGGASGMAGAAVLAARGALRSGVGMVRLVVGRDSLGPVQASVIEATACTWPLSREDLDTQVGEYAHAVLAGPGLGRSPESRVFLDQLLQQWSGPVVLDADALFHFTGRLDELREMLHGRPALLTPHAGELARLLGISALDVVAERFDAGRDIARALGAVVLLKGVPTVLTAPDGERLVSATGTPALAAAGSGDVLGGIAVTLLAQSGDALGSAACAAWAHGRAAEVANAGRPVRGVVLDDILRALPVAWRFDHAALPPPLLARLPRAGDRV